MGRESRADGLIEFRVQIVRALCSALKEKAAGSDTQPSQTNHHWKCVCVCAACYIMK